MVDPVVLDGETLTPGAVVEISEGRPVVLGEAARAEMRASARWLAGRAERDVLRAKWAWLVGGEPPDDSATAVHRFVVDHCAGVGEPIQPALVRATMAVRANTLATGCSGARPEVVDTLLAMLNADIVPVVPSLGDVGAAGSIPLAHIARVVLRFGGEAWRDGERVSAEVAMAGISPLIPTEKDALSLINGSSFATAAAAIALERSRTVLHTFDGAAALTMEVVQADRRALSSRGVTARHHPGGIQVAETLRTHTAGSSLVHHARRPDAFSVRCTPAVHGAAWDALAYIDTTIGRELNAAVDNPLVFHPHEIVEGGNFHGAPVGLVMDHLKTALVQVAGISERRVFRLTYAQLSGLPSFLVPGSGVNSGLMLAQYTAASLVSEAKALAHPASVDSVPVVQHHEDHVSMASVASCTALRVVDLAADVAAIELLCGAQGLDLRLDQDDVPGAGTRRLWEEVRRHVDRWTDDRVLHTDLVALGSAVRAGCFHER